MGCAFINNKSQIKVNEVDITGEATNPHKSYSNDTNILQVKSDDIIIINDLKKIGNLRKTSNKSKINNNIINKKNKSSNNLEYNFSGPIINLLRNKVDNYQRKKF